MVDERRGRVLLLLLPAMGVGVGCGARNGLDSGAWRLGTGGATVTTTVSSTESSTSSSTTSASSSSGSGPSCTATCSGGGCVLLSKQFSDGVFSVSGLGEAIVGDRLTGDVVVAGSYEGPLDLGLGPLPWDGVSDGLFLARYDANGSPIWTKGWPTTVGVGAAPPPLISQLVSVGPDLLVIGPDANVVATGCPGAGPNARVVKLAADGTCVWAHPLSNASPSNAAVDGNQDVLVAGHGLSPPDVGCGPLVAGGTFVAKLRGSDGSCIWSHALTTVPGLEEGMGLAVDASSAVYVGGALVGSFAFAGQTLTSISESGDAVLFKLDAQGNEVWARSWGSTAFPWTQSWIDGVAITKDQRVWISGLYNQGITFGTQTLGEAPWSGFVAGLTPDGDLVSSVSLTSSVGTTQGRGTLLVDSADELVTARRVATGNGPITIGGDVVSGSAYVYLLASLDPADGLAAKWATLSPPGVDVFAETPSGVWWDTPLAIDGCDDVLVTGQTIGGSTNGVYFARLHR